MSTQTTRELIAELYGVYAQHAGLLKRRAPTEAITSRLETIAATRDAFAIPRVIAFVLDDRRAVAEAASQAIAQLRRQVHVRELAALDRELRDHVPWSAEAGRWHYMKPAALDALAALPDARTLLQLSMSHPNGHIREAAMRRCATASDGSEVPFLLLRANDWVEPVRTLAEAMLRAKLAPEHLPHVVAALPILDAMGGWHRLETIPIRAEIEDRLRDRAAIPALVAALAGTDHLIRRCAYSRLWQQPAAAFAAGLAPGASKAAVVAAALRDADPAIRASTGLWVTTADAELFAGFAEQLLRHRSPAIRVRATERLQASGGRLPWSALLLDPHAEVRALAQQAALDAGADPDTEYRARIATSAGRQLGVALRGLGETGGPADLSVAAASGSTPSRSCEQARCGHSRVCRPTISSLPPCSHSVTRARWSSVPRTICCSRSVDRFRRASSGPCSPAPRTGPRSEPPWA